MHLRVGSQPTPCSRESRWRLVGHNPVVTCCVHAWNHIAVPGPNWSVSSGESVFVSLKSLLQLRVCVFLWNVNKALLSESGCWLYLNMDLLLSWRGNAWIAKLTFSTDIYIFFYNTSIMHIPLLYAMLAATKCKHSCACPLVIISERGTARKFNLLGAFQNECSWPRCWHASPLPLSPLSVILFCSF